MSQKKYIPALKYHILTPVYDRLVKWTTRESLFKNLLISQANIKAKYTVVDIGCGTGTLLLLLKKRHPESKIIGIDGDEKIINIAKDKIKKENVEIQVDYGMSFALPYKDNSIDTVMSSLFFHHLTTVDKNKTLAEIYRVLRPGGEVHIADWGKATNFIMRTAFFIVQILDGFTTTNDNVNGMIPLFLKREKFQDIEETKTLTTIYGTLSFYKAKKE